MRVLAAGCKRSREKYCLFPRHTAENFLTRGRRTYVSAIFPQNRSKTQMARTLRELLDTPFQAIATPARATPTIAAILAKYKINLPIKRPEILAN